MFNRVSYVDRLKSFHSSELEKLGHLKERDKFIACPKVEMNLEKGKKPIETQHHQQKPSPTMTAYCQDPNRSSNISIPKGKSINFSKPMVIDTEELEPTPY